MRRLNVPEQLRSFLKPVYYVVLLLFFLTSCAEYGVVVKAENSGIPVLLGKKACIGAAENTSTCTSNNVVYNSYEVSVQDSELFVTGGNGNSKTTRIHEDGTKVDSVILSNTLNDQNLNVYVDRVKTSASAVYFWLGFKRTTKVKLTGHSEKIVSDSASEEKKIELGAGGAIDETSTEAKAIQTERE